MLDDRKTAILSAVVQEYIATAQPVGSGHIAEAPTVKVSSATVRNEMAHLEHEGYLVQPHTSAGGSPPTRDTATSSTISPSRAASTRRPPSRSVSSSRRRTDDSRRCCTRRPTCWRHSPTAPVWSSAPGPRRSRCGGCSSCRCRPPRHRGRRVRQRHRRERPHRTRRRRRRSQAVVRCPPVGRTRRSGARVGQRGADRPATPWSTGSVRALDACLPPRVPSRSSPGEPQPWRTRSTPSRSSDRCWPLSSSSSSWSPW
jgi:hypothetical protein